MFILVLFVVFIIFALFIACINMDENHTNSSGIQSSVRITSDHVSVVQESDGRMIDGHFLRTEDDWKRWWVLYGYAGAIEQTMHEIERNFSNLDAKPIDELFEDWKRRYQEYRSICIRIGMWNREIEDREPFVPTQRQISAESALFRRMEAKKSKAQTIRDEAENQRREKENAANQILTYLSTCPDRCALRTEVIRLLAGNQKPTNVEQSLYRELIKDKILTEKKNENGRYVVKKARKRTVKKEQLPVPVTRSVYNPELYKNVDKSTLYKVEYTVGEPINLDSDMNCCVFNSKSRDCSYQTTLTNCSCSAFSKGYPCKHMVALAIRLRYFDPSTVRQ